MACQRRSQPTRETRGTRLAVRKHYVAKNVFGPNARECPVPALSGTPMSALGHERTFCDATTMAALPPEADIRLYKTNVR